MQVGKDEQASRNLGPLPAPEGQLFELKTPRGKPPFRYFEEWQMRAYAAQEVAAERERCAKLCEDISEEYQRREGRKYPELRTDAEEGANKCAAAIRGA